MEIAINSCLILVAFLTGCSYQKIENQRTTELSKIDFNAVVCVEAFDKDTIKAFLKSDVVLINLETGKKYYITDDHYRYKNPAFFSNGQKLIYGSSKRSVGEQDSVLREIHTLSGILRGYLYNIRTSQEKMILRYKDISLFYDFNFCRNDSVVIFYNLWQNNLVEYNLYSQKQDVVYSLDKDYIIHKIVPDSNPDSFFIEYCTASGDSSAYKIYNSKTKSIVDIVVKFQKKPLFFLAANSEKNEIYLYRSAQKQRNEI